MKKRWRNKAESMKKKWRNKAALTAALAAVMALSLILASCGAAIPGNNSGGGNSGGAATKPDNEPVTFTIYIEDYLANRTEEDFKSDISKKITEDTGVTIKYNFGIGDVAEQITLMVADRSYPDFVFSRSHLYNFLEAEAYIDLAPMIDQYGQNIKWMYGANFDHLKDDDGSIWYLGQDFVNIVLQDPEDAFEIQNAVLKDQGYPEIRTLEQFGNAIRAYKAKYPTIDGQPTIGMTLCCAEGWRYYITLINPGMRAFGYPDDGNFYVDPDTYEVTYAYTIPGIGEYYRWLNGLYNDGMLDPDSFTQTYDEYLAKISSGRVLALSDGLWEYEDAENILMDDGKDERTYARFPATMNKDILHPAYRMWAYVPQNGVGITDKCSDPELALKFLDYLCQEDTQILTNWGIEGKHWEIRDGKRRWTAEEAALRGSSVHQIETGIGLMTYPWPAIGAALDSKGYKFTPLDDDEAIIEGYSEATKETLSHYGGDTWKSLFPQPSAFKPSEWGQAWLIWDNQPPNSEFTLLMQECYDLTAQYLPIVCSCRPEEFDAKWGEFIQRLYDADVVRLGEEATQVLADNFFVHIEEDEDEGEDDEEAVEEADGEGDGEEEEVEVADEEIDEVE